MVALQIEIKLPPDQWLKSLSERFSNYGCSVIYLRQNNVVFFLTDLQKNHMVSVYNMQVLIDDSVDNTVLPTPSRLSRIN